MTISYGTGRGSKVKTLPGGASILFGATTIIRMTNGSNNNILKEIKKLNWVERIIYYAVTRKKFHYKISMEFWKVNSYGKTFPTVYLDSIGLPYYAYQYGDSHPTSVILLNEITVSALRIMQ